MTALVVEPVGEVELLSLVGERLTVRAARPLPPGTRVTLRTEGEARPLAQGKILSIDNRDPASGACDVSIGLFAPERWARERLEAYQKKDPPR